MDGAGNLALQRPIQMLTIERRFRGVGRGRASGAAVEVAERSGQKIAHLVHRILKRAPWVAGKPLTTSGIALTRAQLSVCQRRDDLAAVDWDAVRAGAATSASSSSSSG